MTIWEFLDKNGSKIGEVILVAMFLVYLYKLVRASLDRDRGTQLNWLERAAHNRLVEGSSPSVPIYFSQLFMKCQFACQGDQSFWVYICSQNTIIGVYLQLSKFALTGYRFSCQGDKGIHHDHLTCYECISNNLHRIFTIHYRVLDTYYLKQYH